MRHQPTNRDRRSMLVRGAGLLLAHPEPALRLLGEHDARWLDGRRLHRSLQLLLALGERTGQLDRSFEVETMRRDLRSLAVRFSPSRRGVHTWDRHIPGPAGLLTVRCYRPHGATGELPTVLYAHGGGFVTGDLDSHDPTCRVLADEARCAVMAVDYRLAPEHPFPAAVDDLTAAYRWLRDHLGELGGAPGVVGVMGDSAGATLAAVLCQEVRRLELPPPTMQCLVYPLTDTRCQTPSYATFAEGFSLTMEAIDWFRSRYTPDEATWTDPRVSPLCADDLGGLPPALVITAGFDPLRDDGLAYAEALAAAGVPTTYRCYDDMIHGFHGMLVLPDAAAAATEIAVRVGTMLRGEV